MIWLISLDGIFDLRVLIRMLFGAGEFEECIGELSIGVMMDPSNILHNIILYSSQHSNIAYHEMPREQLEAELQKSQIEREQMLIEKYIISYLLWFWEWQYYFSSLLKKIDLYMKNDLVGFRKFIEADIASKEDAPGGAELLYRLGIAIFISLHSFIL
jgi:hypothetical protein